MYYNLFRSSRCLENGECELRQCEEKSSKGQEDESKALYEGARITKETSDQLIASFLCKANLNDEMKKELNKLLVSHVPLKTRLRQDYLPENSPCYAIETTDVDSFILLPLKFQYETLVKRTGIKHSNARSVIVFIDGGARYKKGTDSFWPFLAFLFPENLQEYKELSQRENMIVVGLSKKKPKCPKPSNIFIKRCCEAIEKAGLTIKNVTADTPARSFALNHSAFNGKQGCTYCKIRGERSSGRTLYMHEAAIQADPKTEETYDRQTDGVYGESPFLNVERPDAFRIDVMHQLGCGLTKRLLQLLLRGSEV